MSFQTAYLSFCKDNKNLLNFLIFMIKIECRDNGGETPERNSRFIGIQKIIHKTMRKVGDETEDRKQAQ